MMTSESSVEQLAMIRLKRFTYVRVVSSVVYAASLLPSIDAGKNFLLVFMSIVLTEGLAAYFLLLGLRKLSLLDSVAFRRSALLVEVYLFGVVALALGGGITFGSIGSFGMNLEIGQLVQVASLVGTGGLIAMLVGSFGAMQGLWRTGRRYNRTSIKLGAVLFIVPYVNIVSDFLLLGGIRRASTGHD